MRHLAIGLVVLVAVFGFLVCANEESAGGRVGAGESAVHEISLGG